MKYFLLLLIICSKINVLEAQSKNDTQVIVTALENDSYFDSTALVKPTNYLRQLLLSFNYQSFNFNSNWNTIKNDLKHFGEVENLGYNFFSSGISDISNIKIHQFSFRKILSFDNFNYDSVYLDLNISNELNRSYTSIHFVKNFNSNQEAARLFYDSLQSKYFMPITKKINEGGTYDRSRPFVYLKITKNNTVSFTISKNVFLDMYHFSLPIQYLYAKKSAAFVEIDEAESFRGIKFGANSSQVKLSAKLKKLPDNQRYTFYSDEYRYKTWKGFEFDISFFKFDKRNQFSMVQLSSSYFLSDISSVNLLKDRINEMISILGVPNIQSDNNILWIGKKVNILFSFEPQKKISENLHSLDFDLYIISNKFQYETEKDF